MRCHTTTFTALNALIWQGYSMEYAMLTQSLREMWCYPLTGKTDAHEPKPDHRPRHERNDHRSHRRHCLADCRMVRYGVGA